MMKTTISAHIPVFSLTVSTLVEYQMLDRVKLLNAVNAALGELSRDEKNSKEDSTTLRYQKASKTLPERVSATAKALSRYTGTMNIALRFALMDETFRSIESGLLAGNHLPMEEFPEIFQEWMKKFTLPVEASKVA